MFDFDLFVIGGGSGGVRAARVASEAGASVGLAEEYRLGGTCVIRGCVPKKLMVYASGFADAFADSAGFGWTAGEASFDWSKFMTAKDSEIDRLESIYRANLQNAGVILFDEHATLADAHTIQLGSGRKVKARYLLIATGGSPYIPEFPGSDLASTSNEIFLHDRLPEKTLIVGGGYIACEFAGILNGMGSQITQFYRGDQILRGFDDDVRQHIAGCMARRGIDLRLKTEVASISGEEPNLLVTDQDGNAQLYDYILYATGRRPNTAGLGLEDAGVKLGRRGEVIVDKFSQSTVPSIFAVGDVTNRVNLTPVAIREGAAFVETIFNSNPTPADHIDVPTAVFTRPELGTVGMTEQEALAELAGVDIYVTAFRPLANAMSGRDEKNLMKLVVEKSSQRVRGVQIVGEGAAEMIQLAGIAVKMKATKADFDRTVAVHPTAAEELVTFKRPVRTS